MRGFCLGSRGVSLGGGGAGRSCTVLSRRKAVKFDGGEDALSKSYKDGNNSQEGGDGKKENSILALIHDNRG